MDNDIEIRLEEYSKKAEEAMNKELSDYPTLRDMEEEYCAIINEGNSIRKQLISNPDLIDRNSYLFLTNQVVNAEIIDDKYKSLLLVIRLSKKLFITYLDYAKILDEKQEYEELINIYSACFRLTEKTVYKRRIADIIFEKYNDASQAISIYSEIEKDFTLDSTFYEQYAKMYSAIGDIAKSEDYVALSKELSRKDEAKALIDEKNFEDAIKIYDELYKETGKTSYRLEVANINAVFLSNMNKAIEIYKELEDKLKDDKDYWYKLSDLYWHIENYFRHLVCMQKAIKIELNRNVEEVV